MALRPRFMAGLVGVADDDRCGPSISALALERPTILAVVHLAGAPLLGDQQAQ